MRIQDLSRALTLAQADMDSWLGEAQFQESAGDQGAALSALDAACKAETQIRLLRAEIEAELRPLVSVAEAAGAVRPLRVTTRSDRHAEEMARTTLRSQRRTAALQRQAQAAERAARRLSAG